MSRSNSIDLPDYFTNRDDLLKIFEELITSPIITSSDKLRHKHILIIHGVGGVGKSAILEMFRIRSRERDACVPHAFASGDESKSAIMILSDWAKHLEAEGIRLEAFDKTLTQYRDIQAKAEDNAKELMTERVPELANKMAELAAKSLPLPDFAAKFLGGGAEVLTTWLLDKGFAKPDVDLLLNPDKKLTDNFLSEIRQATKERRLVLMLDAFEKLTALDEWLCDLAQQLSPNVLLIIAGREAPIWSEHWPTWPSQVRMKELKPMDHKNMIELVRRYYAVIDQNGLEEDQATKIANFSRGLPMAVITSAGIWVKYDFEDFEKITTEVVSDLVKLLTWDIGKDPVLNKVLKAASALRGFNKSILEEVMGEEIPEDVYYKLKNLPFIRPLCKRLTIHDSIREFVDENHRLEDDKKHCVLHERAAKYFEGQIGKSGEDAERMGAERLYHSIRANESEGIKLFQKIAGDLTRFRLIGGLRALLNDASTYPLREKNSRLWRDYWNARLKHLEGHLSEAKQTYEKIRKDKDVDQRLLAYALTDLGPLLFGKEYFDAIKNLEACLKSVDMDMDSKLAIGLTEIAISYRRNGDPERGTKNLKEAIEYYEESKDNYGLVTAQDRLKKHYFYQGLLREAFELEEVVRKEFACFSIPTMLLKVEILGAKGGVFRAWYGRFYETEKDLREALEISEKLEVPNRYIETCDLGYALGMQGKYKDAEYYFVKSLEISKELPSGTAKFQNAIVKGFRGAVLLRRGHFDKAREELEKSMKCKQETGDHVGMPEIYVWLGQLYETKALKGLKSGIKNMERAESYYDRCLDMPWIGRYYLECGAHTGLARVKYSQREYSEMKIHLDESKKLAQRYEYNDQLASQSLIKGHSSWDGVIPEEEGGFKAALSYYQHALIYALRYNRFLLDEVLSGRKEGTYLRPIMVHCNNRGEDGEEMLQRILYWWGSAKNEITTDISKPSNVSPIPRGIPLKEAERIARDLEPGNGLYQTSVVEQLENAISSKNVS